MDSKLYEGFHVTYPQAEAVHYFVGKHGYMPDRCSVVLGLLRVGPIIPVRVVNSASVRAGDCLLVAGVWVTIEDCDNGTVLTSEGDLITLSDTVTIREGA